MKTLQEVTIPKDAVNDDEVLIVDVLFRDGDQVAEGDRLLVYETSKATVEITAEVGGYVVYLFKAGEFSPVGQPVALITEQPVEKPAPSPAPAPAGWDLSAPTGVVFSRAARAHMQKQSVDPSRFAHCDLVSLEDVLEQQRPAEDGRIPVVILGAGGHGLVSADLVVNAIGFRLRGFLDDGIARGAVVSGYPVLGGLADIATVARDGAVATLVAVGMVDPDPALRMRAFGLAEAARALLPPFVHPSAMVDRRAVLGRGVQVHAGAVVGPEAVLGDGVVVNTAAVVSHHCRIDRHTHIAPGAVLAGMVSVGEGSLIGIGVTSYVGIRIGSRCVIENGANLLKSVPDGKRVSA
jgi:sugar O-acyltransferase (sialic acid O-acetyltransferase NeuD family)